MIEYCATTRWASGGWIAGTVGGLGETGPDIDALPMASGWPAWVCLGDAEETHALLTASTG